MKRRRGPSFLEQILRRIAPPRHPEYEEYIGEPPEIDLDGTERPVATPTVGADDDEAEKVRRLRILSVFIAVFSIAGFIYFYLTNDASTTRRARTQDLLAVEAARELAPEGARRGEESLSDIRRWTQEMEDRVAREMDRGETYTAPRTGVAPVAPYAAPPPAAAWTLPPELLVPSSTDTQASWSPPPTAERPEPAPRAGAPSAPSTTRPEPVRLPPAATEATTETSYSPYRRRVIAPITIEPRTTEPY
jgi:hypothetical protein